MTVKFILRGIFFVLLAVVKLLFGIDWALIVAAVVIVGDLDEIADAIDNRLKKDC